MAVKVRGSLLASTTTARDARPRRWRLRRPPADSVDDKRECLVRKGATGPREWRLLVRSIITDRKEKCHYFRISCNLDNELMNYPVSVLYDADCLLVEHQNEAGLLQTKDKRDPLGVRGARREALKPLSPCARVPASPVRRFSGGEFEVFSGLPRE